MRYGSLSKLRPNEKGESNAKFITVMVVIAIVAYIVYTILPIYYKEQQLKHDMKEEVRIGAVNGAEVGIVEKKVKKHVDDIDFPQPIVVKGTKKGDNLTIACTGVVPVNFIVYTYKYKIDLSETFNRGGY